MSIQDITANITTAAGKYAIDQDALAATDFLALSDAVAQEFRDLGVSPTYTDEAGVEHLRIKSVNAFAGLHALSSRSLRVSRPASGCSPMATWAWTFSTCRPTVASHSIRILATICSLSWRARAA
jgi:hypothetical protein